jgi:hypothetical protein
MNPRHDAGRFNVNGVSYDVFRDKSVTQVMSIDRGLDASSTSRAKLQNLSLTTEGNINAEKFGTFIGELIMASGIHITVDPMKGVLIGGMKYNADAKRSAQAQISRAKSQVDSYIDNKFLTKAEYKSLIKFLKPAQPKGEDKANGLRVLAKVLENFHTFAPYLPPSIKSVIIAFVKQDVDLSMGGYNIVKAWGENLKELLPGKDEGANLVISYKDLTDEYIKQLEVARSIKNFMNNMAVSPMSVEGSDRLLTTLGLSQGKITTTFITDRDTPKEFMNDIAVHATKLAGNALVKPLKGSDIETFIGSLDYKIGNKLNSTSNEESIILKHGNDIENNKNDFSTLQFLDGNSKPIRTEEVLDKIAAQIIGKENDSLNDKVVKRSIANALIGSMDLANQRVVSNYSNGMTSKVLTTMGNSREGKRFKVTPEFASNFKTLTHIFDSNELNALIKRDVSSCK